MDGPVLESSGEAGWLKSFRKKSFENFKTLPLEQSRLFAKYADAGALDLEKFGRPEKKRENIPERFKGYEGAALVRGGDEVFLSSPGQELQKSGVIFTDMLTAVEKYPELVKKHLLSDSENQSKLEAFNSAFFGNGTFLYVPEGLEVANPLRSLYLENGTNASSRSIIIADSLSSLVFMEENFSLNGRNQPSLFTNFTSVFLGEGARVDFGGLQNLGSGVTNVDIKKSFCEADSHIAWNIAMFGGKFTKSQVDSVLKGDGSAATDNEMIFANETQRFDTMSSLVHIGESTTGKTVAKGVMKGSASAVMKGAIDIGKGAKNSNSYLAEHAMLLGKDAKADAIPSLEIRNKDVKATHSASVAQVGEDQMFYLMTRGLSESDAKKMLVRGFFEPLIQAISPGRMRETTRAIVDLKWTGEKVVMPHGILLSLSEDAEQVQRQDMFGGHYKYR
ncbi:MAG: SufD family Fe-S cluster assembly protein [Candidatus Aenigmarchaeota archaeon]|nr:SufD family Fe-S cluster assembly protein [Candidatus Aenigmarchaeota archaeon]